MCISSVIIVVSQQNDQKTAKKREWIKNYLF